MGTISITGKINANPETDIAEKPKPGYLSQQYLSLKKKVREFETYQICQYILATQPDTSYINVFPVLTK